MPDQMFGEIAGLLVRMLTPLTPQCFIDAVRNGLKRPRNQNRGVYVGELPKTRDWKHWTEPLDVSIGGLAGAGAAHSIRLVRRRGHTNPMCGVFVRLVGTKRNKTNPNSKHTVQKPWAADLDSALEKLVESTFVDPPSMDDIVCLCKHWMHDSRLMQPPFVICPGDRKSALDPHGPQHWAGSRPLPTKKVQAYMKTVKKLRCMSPWDMKPAADYLESWLNQRSARECPSGNPPPVTFFAWIRTKAANAGIAVHSAWEHFCKTDASIVKVKPRPKPKPKPKSKSKAKATPKPKAKPKAKGKSQPTPPSPSSSDA
jgi:hypothetical protein